MSTQFESPSHWIIVKNNGRGWVRASDDQFATADLAMLGKRKLSSVPASDCYAYDVRAVWADGSWDRSEGR